jgi:4-amino-4-deoxy-L-arabinose transferase-like glycosyltransferase
MTSRTLAVTLLCALAVAWFGTLGERKLVRPDEGRYAEIAREMVVTGDWTTPRLNGYKYFEKPALQYWATAAAFEVFGVREWSARLWAAFTGFLGVLLVFHFGNRAFGPPVGGLAAAVLAGSIFWAVIGHINSLDTGVSIFMSLAVLGAALAQLDDASAQQRRGWMHVAWAAAALAVLSKGLIGIVLPAGALGLYILMQRDWRRLARLHIGTGMLLFTAVAAPWFIAVSAANDEFFHFFFIQEHFQRFLTKAHGRYQPAWYFIPILLIGFSPWIVSLVPALGRAWHHAPGRGLAVQFRPARFLLIWSVMVFAFFSASGSKLPSYILPIFPALAVLVALHAAAAGRALLAAQSALYAAIGIAAALLAPQIMRAASDELPPELLAQYVPWVRGAGLCMLASAVCSAYLAKRRNNAASVVLLAAGGLVASLSLLLGHETLSPAYSAYHIAEKIRPELKADVPFYSVNTFDHTLPFYLGRTVTMVAYKDELAQPIGWEPGTYIPDLAAFARAWQSDRDAWAVFSANDFAKMQNTLQIPMQVVARDPRRVVVRKP